MHRLHRLQGENLMSEMPGFQPFSRDKASDLSIGHVVEVHGPVVDIACDVLPPLHRALTVAIDGANAVLEVLHHLDPQRPAPASFLFHSAQSKT